MHRSVSMPSNPEDIQNEKLMRSDELDTLDEIPSEWENSFKLSSNFLVNNKFENKFESDLKM